MIKIQDSHLADGSTSFEMSGQRALGSHSPGHFLFPRGRFVSLALPHSSSSPQESGRGAGLRLRIAEERQGPTAQLHLLLLCSCLSLSLPFSFLPFLLPPWCLKQQCPPHHTSLGTPSLPGGTETSGHGSLEQRINSVLL